MNRLLEVIEPVEQTEEEYEAAVRELYQWYADLRKAPKKPIDTDPEELR